MDWRSIECDHRDAFLLCDVFFDILRTTKTTTYAREHRAYDVYMIPAFTSILVGIIGGIFAPIHHRINSPRYA